MAARPSWNTLNQNQTEPDLLVPFPVWPFASLVRFGRRRDHSSSRSPRGFEAPRPDRTVGPREREKRPIYISGHLWLLFKTLKEVGPCGGLIVWIKSPGVTTCSSQGKLHKVKKNGKTQEDDSTYQLE